MTAFKSIFLVIFSVFISFCLSGQNRTYYPQPKHPEWFKAIPQIDDSTPLWIVTLYEEDDNFVKIEALKREFYKTNKWEKNIHTQNYKYWLKNVQNHVGDDGRVNKPSETKNFLSYASKTRKSTTRNSSVQWVNIGPANTVSNNQSRPTQANVYCIGVSPSNTSIIYAGMETGGIFKSTDKGLTWNPISYDYAITTPSDIKVDPLNSDIVYVLVGKTMYKSINGGSTWDLHYTAADNFEQLLIHPTAPTTLYAATRGGLLKSTDGGTSWTSKYTGYIYDVEAQPGTPSTLYISIKNDTAIRPEIYKSIDSGDNWVLKDSGFYVPSDLANATIFGCKIGVTPADSNRVYAGVIASGKSGDNGWIGIYYSEDGGETWQNDSGFDGASIDNGDGTWSYPPGNDMNTNWYVAGYSSGYHQGWYNFDIDVSHNDPDKLWIGTIWFCESGNKGGNVEYIRGTRSLNMHADIQDIDVVGNDIWIASDGGLNYSNDECQTMETRMLGITASDFWGFGQGWNEDVWVGGRYHNGNAAFHENYGAGNTLFLGGAEAPTGYVNQHSNKNVYFSDIGDKKLPLALNENASSIPNLGLYPTQSYLHFSYSEVEWHPYKGNEVFIGKDNILYKSTNGGQSFDSLYTFAGNMRRFEISREDPNVIYTIIYVDYWTWEVHRSNDGGNTFTKLTAPPISGGSWRQISFTLNPFDKNEIWIASNSSSNGNKVFSSTDGGSTWTNRYSIELENEKIKDMIYHGDVDNDKIYVMTNDNYFYFDKTDGSWNSFNEGLPVLHSGFITLPFYRDNKIRMGSSKGIWEREFVSSSKVQAMPMIDNASVLCVRDTSQLESYSIIDPVGASWEWSFSPAPLYVSNVNARNPKVVFGALGSYDATLTITDANGNTNSRTVINFATVQNECNPDDFAGNALKTYTNGEGVVMKDANLTNITHFTVTGWWKPSGAQQAYSALFSSGDWCAHCNDTEGLIFDYSGSKLWYKWTGSASSWGSNSGIKIPLDEWSYVALVIEPDKATMYLNDQKYIHNTTLLPGDIPNLHIAFGHYNKSFKGDIDEVTFWTKALSEDEIYELRHITKEDEIENDPDLLAYYQFNALYDGSYIIDKAGTRHGVIHENSELLESGAPVGGGVSELITIDPLVKEYDFSTSGSTLYLSDCDELEGKINMTRLNSKLDTSNFAYPQIDQTWIINSYTSSGPIGIIDSIVLTSSDVQFFNTLPDMNEAHIHTRGENEDSPTWVPQTNAVALNGNVLAYNSNSKITGDKQITVTNGASPYEEIEYKKPCEVDTIPGRMLNLPGGSGNYAIIPAMNLNTNTMTISAWIKPNGIQNNWAGIVFSRAANTVAGLSMLNSNELRYHWDGEEWGWSSGAFANLDVWNHVAFVVEPGSATIYLNGIAHTRYKSHAIEEFNGQTRIGNDANSSSRTFNGQIDEVCIWNRALSQTEIRSLRHLTKNNEVETDSNLIAYYQFNEESGLIYDKTSSHFNAAMNGAIFREKSNTPVGGGISDFHYVNGPTSINSATGMDVTFGNSGNYPEGEIVFSRINVTPDVLPGTSPVSKSYWIINNYGTNKTVTSIEALTFHDIGNMTMFSETIDYAFAVRSENDFGSTWSTQNMATERNVATKSITFNQGINLSNLGQFVIDNTSAKGWIGVDNTDWQNTLNWGSGLIPTMDDEVVIPAHTPFHPRVEIGVKIKSLLLQPHSKFSINPQKSFEILGEN